MSKIKKVKDIDNYTPRLESIYESQKSKREQAIKVAKSVPDEIKKPTKYDLKR